MTKKLWLTLFFIITAADIFAIASDNNDLRWFTKVFIIPLLAGYYISSLILIRTAFRKWIPAALFFSWCGDVLLMLEPYKSQFFTLGLVAFLLAHICYIDFFQLLIRKEKIRLNPLLIAPVFLYYVVLMILLFPHLGSLKIPVLIYGFIISSMLALALHTLRLKNQDAGLNIAGGAILFIVSDSVLAINKFYKPFEGAGVIILVTYALAQLLIVTGAIKYMRKSGVS
jgi:uncharacterized membrane protein YhhN